MLKILWLCFLWTRPAQFSVQPSVPYEYCLAASIYQPRLNSSGMYVGFSHLQSRCPSVQLFADTITEYYVTPKNESQVVWVVLMSFVWCCTLIGLRPFTEYTFAVVVCTAAGCTTSASTSVRTLPHQPAGLCRLSNDSVFLLRISVFLMTWSTHL